MDYSYTSDKAEMLLKNSWLLTRLNDSENIVDDQSFDLNYVSRWKCLLETHSPSVEIIKEIDDFLCKHDKISRGDLFDWAKKVAKREASHESLLWLSNAWGGGTSLRNAPGQIKSIYSSNSTNKKLIKCFDDAKNDKIDHAFLCAKNIANGLGISFFTKYMYFASFGAGTATGIGRPGSAKCLILDKKVADSLNQMGFSEFANPQRWIWSKTQKDNPKRYRFYCELLHETGKLLHETGKIAGVRPDEIERALWERGGA